MKYSMIVVAALALVALLDAPQVAYGQSKEYNATKDVQREVSILGQTVETFRTNQAERIAELEAQIKQLRDSNAKLSASLEDLKSTLKQSLTAQQSSLAEPISTLRGNVDTLSENMTALREQFSTLDKRSRTTDGNVEEILRIGRQLLATPAPSATVATPAAAPAVDTAKDLLQTANRDYNTGKDERAMAGFDSYINTYPTSPDAPYVLFMIGKLYDKAGMNEDAIKAFDRVLEQYPENPIKPDALFEKAEQFLKIGKKPEALKEFRAFKTRYPADPNITSVEARITELQRPAPPPAKAAKSRGKNGK